MKNIMEILPANITEALGWTLVHSIWQGIILVAILVVFNFGLKKSSQKYNLSIGLMATQICISIFTYLIIYEPITPIQIAEASNFQPIKTSVFLVQNIEKAPLTFEIVQWFSGKIPIIVNIWILGICFYSCRFIFNYWQVKQLKTKDLFIPADNIVKIFNEIKNKAIFQKSLQIMESGRIYTPVLIGYLKPIILLPIGLCSHLSMKEVEAIIAHELAHAKRNDYLVNLIQSIIDIVYFFNPAIVYLSNYVREERENCCDEFATNICGDKMPIARALVSIESFRQESNLAMAFGRKTNPLTSRIQKILGLSTEKANGNKGILAFVTLVLVSIFYLNIENSNAQQNPKPKTNKPKKSIKITEKNGIYHNYTDDEEGVRKIFVDNGKEKLTIIQKDATIFVNGKEYKLSNDDSLKMMAYQGQIKKLSGEINQYSEKINGLSNQINVYSGKINHSTMPINEKSEEINKLSEKISDLAEKQSKLARKLSSLDDEKDAQLIKKLEAEDAKYEAELSNLEDKIEKISSEIEDLSGNIEKETEPIDSLSEEIEKYSKPIEELSEKMEKLSLEMYKLYPKEAIEAYERVTGSKRGLFLSIPTPPTPPTPPTAPTPPIPPRAPKSPRRGAYVVPPTAPHAPHAPFAPKAPKAPRTPYFGERTGFNELQKSSKLEVINENVEKWELVKEFSEPIEIENKIENLASISVEEMVDLATLQNNETKPIRIKSKSRTYSNKKTPQKP